MAAVQPERILQGVQTLAGVFVSAVHYPAIGLQQRRGTQIPFGIPPITRACRGTAGAQDARGREVYLFLILPGLKPLPVRRGRRSSLQPRLDGGVLGVEIGQVGDQVLYDGHMRQRIDFQDSPKVLHRLGAGERVGTADIHRAGPTNALPARTAESERRIDLVLDLDQGIQNHGPAGIHVDLISIQLRRSAGIGIVPVDLERARVARAACGRVRLAGLDPGIHW